MNKLYTMGLMAPDGDTGASGAVTESVNTDAQSVFENGGGLEGSQESGSTSEAHQGQQSEGASTAASSAAPITPNSVTMTNEQLTALASQMVRGMPQAQTQQQAPGPITPEQQAAFDQQFGVVRITPEKFQAIMGFAPQSEAQMKQLENTLHDVARMSNAMAVYQMKQEMTQREATLMERVNPAMAYIQQQQASALENDFFTAAADLKDFKPLVAEVTAAAKAQGLKFPTKEAAITYVANRVRGYLKQASGGTTSPKSGATARKTTMPTISMGGRTGSTNSSQQSVSGPQAVFGNMDAE